MISIHKTLFNSLDKILNKADRLKYDQHFVTHESSDFTRKSRKLSFKDTISFILSMAGKPIREELLDFFHYSNNTPLSRPMRKPACMGLPTCPRANSMVTSS